MTGCYYMQAARGQLDMLRKREDIADVITDDATSAELAARLQLVLDARAFSVEVLGLPDNDSYTTYADLERDFAVYSIIAVPEFSVEPRTWCYPIVGCVGYRGYFSEDKARKEAERMRAAGFDVAFGGVAAYSTLGKFDDPVLNTMMHWDDVQLVSVMFHELAHQQLYIKNDTTFNESFATAVEEVGVERWLAARNKAGAYEDWRRRRDVTNAFAALVIDARENLEVVYSNGGDDTAMRATKEAIFQQLAASSTALFEDAGLRAPQWLAEGPNNARIASISLYNQRVPEFRDMFEKCGQDFVCFYERAAALGGDD